MNTKECHRGPLERIVSLQLRQLEWQDVPGEKMAIADTPWFGSYHCWQNDRGARAEFCTAGGTYVIVLDKRGLTLDDAKQAAERDWKSRVMASLQANTC